MLEGCAVSERITDERLADLAALAAYANKDPVWDDEMIDIATALRELQQRRRNELQLIADINAMGSDDD